MIVPFPVRVSWSVSCAACGVLYLTTPREIPTGGTVPFLALPSGWTVVNDRVYCNLHRIIVQTETAHAVSADND